MVATRRDKTKCLVTGGSGFLGRHLVQQLVESGQYDVTVLDIRQYEGDQVRSITGDLRKAADVEQAVQGMLAVFHVATAAPTGKNARNKELMHSVNVQGTQNVINACVKFGVEKLIYTSSASVVYEGKDLLDVDESQPLASRPMDYYTSTKIEGEKLVLAANGRAGLAAVALRPSGIFGPGDPLLAPALLERARAGRMKFYIGSGTNVMDYTYVGNVAQAHLQAADALLAGSRVAGQAYFITNDEPRSFWGFMGDLLQGLDYPRPHIGIPWLLALILAFIFEYMVMPLLALVGVEVKTEFTTARVTLMCCNRRFSCAKAKRDFEYSPEVSIEEGLKRTVAAFEHFRAPRKAKST